MLAASKDPDTMYYHEAMREPDRERFKGAMKQEVEAHTQNEVWEFIKKSAAPKGHKIMHSSVLCFPLPLLSLTSIMPTHRSNRCSSSMPSVAQPFA